MVTEAEASAILRESKVIGSNLAWKPQRSIYRLEATVLATRSGQLLSLRGYVGAKNRSFALLYKNMPIHMYTVHDRHRNPVSGQDVTEPHKHRWDDLWEDKLVYIPNDIRAGDPNIELIDFLEQCNITLRGNYRSQVFFLGSRRGAP